MTTAFMYPSAVKSRVVAALRKLGMSAINDYYLGLELADQANAYVQVHVTRSTDYFNPGYSLSAKFGLRLHQLHALRAALFGEPDSTDFIGLGYVVRGSQAAPYTKTWSVPASSIAEAVSAFASEVQESILPTLRENCDAEKLCLKILSGDDRFSWVRSDWDPVALLYLGRGAEAARLAYSELASAQANPKLDPEYIRRYAKFAAAVARRASDASQETPPK